MVNLAIFAILPLILPGALLALLVLTGVLSLKPSSFGTDVLDALLLGPVGVIIIGREGVELRSADGQVVVTLPAGSVSSPITLNYKESGPPGVQSIPAGYVSTGRYFDLSAKSVNAISGPVNFMQSLTVSIVIGRRDLDLAAADYSRFYIQHFDAAAQSWDVLLTTADLLTFTVTAEVDSLSPFALTVSERADVGSEIVCFDGQTTATPGPLADPTPTTMAPTVIPTDVPTPAIAPVPTSTPAPTPTPMTLTPTPAPEPTRVATATAVPTPTPTLSPTVNPVPTATPSPTPTLLPTPTPTPMPTSPPLPTQTPLPTMTPTPAPTPLSYQHRRHLPRLRPRRSQSRLPFQRLPQLDCCTLLETESHSNLIGVETSRS